MTDSSEAEGAAGTETHDTSSPPPSSTRSAASALATRAARFASLLYEGLLLVPVVFLASYVLVTLVRDTSADWFRPLLRIWLLAVIGAYFMYCWVRGGQTLAMRTWRLRLTTASGNRVSCKLALARYVFSVWGALLFGVGFWWSFFDRDRQFLHDRLAGTRITRIARD